MTIFFLCCTFYLSLVTLVILYFGTSNAFNSVKKGHKRLFRGFVGHEILPTYMGINNKPFPMVPYHLWHIYLHLVDIYY